MSDSITIIPTRRLNAKQRVVFDRVLREFIHLQASDAEQLTQYAEAVVRYETAQKDTRKHPTISVPVINRSTGNVTGEKIARNPAFATLKEAQNQLNALARRLMIDTASTDKRQRLLTKRARALAAAEAASATAQNAIASLTEEEIQAEMDKLRLVFISATEDQLRLSALWHLTMCYPLLNDPDGADIYAPLDSFPNHQSQG